MPAVIGWIFDAATLAALGAAVFYCFRLSRQLEGIRAGRGEFEALIASLDAATARAATAIAALKEEAAAGAGALQEKIHRARGLSEELEIMIQAGDGLAGRLQSLAEEGRREHAPSPLPEAAGGFQPRTRAERELLEAVRARQQA